VVCIHIAAHAALFLQGLRPRGWTEFRKANQSVVTASSAWLVLLALLLIVFVDRHGLPA